MSTYNRTQALRTAPDAQQLAEVIELPVDSLSFYQRNSGALPKSVDGMGESHSRTQLPSPDNAEDAGFFRRLFSK